MGRVHAPQLLAAALVALAGGASADVLCLTDGRIVEGRPLERREQGVTIHFESGDVLVPNGLILDCIIDGELETHEPANEEERKMLDRGYVRFDGRWMSVAQREREVAERLEERRAYAASLRELSLWRNRGKEETRHFAFEYTVPPHIFEDYRDRMEAYFTAFAKDWKVKPPKKSPRLTVCFYGDAETFHQVSGAGSYTLGYFRYVDPMELDIYYDRLDPHATEEVMFHEANHYLQKLMDVEFSMPHFPGESLAEYYGSSLWDPERKELTVGVVLEGRLTEIQTDLAGGERIGLREMIVDKQYEHYTWGWSLVHFLMNDRRYEKKFHKFVQGLVSGKDVERTPVDSRGLRSVEPADVWTAFCEYLDLDDQDQVAELEREWHDYVENVLEVQSVHGLEQAAFNAIRHDRPIRARRLLSEAIEGGSTNGLTFYRYGRLLLSDKEWDAAVENLERAVELDPLNADFYAGLGYALRKKGERKGGDRMLALAREIDPDDPWLDVGGFPKD